MELPLSGTRPQAWSLIAAGNELSRGSILPYEEDPDSSYRWTSRVPNSSKLQIGDLIVIRDKNQVLGTSIIDSIEISPCEIITLSCPRCSKSQFKSPKEIFPRYRCGKTSCQFEFEHPVETIREGIEYFSSHQTHWIDLSGTLTVQELKKAYLRPDTQHSMTQIDWDKFLAILNVKIRSPLFEELTMMARQSQYVINDDLIIKGGHGFVMARARIGQASFRSKLLDVYNSTCFISGAHPPQALDAAHLYSFAKYGEHKDHGGILLRKDLHSLFDLKMFSINVTAQEIEIGPHLLKYSQYAKFHEKNPFFEMKNQQKNWFEIHYESFINQ